MVRVRPLGVKLPRDFRTVQPSRHEDLSVPRHPQPHAIAALTALSAMKRRRVSSVGMMVSSIEYTNGGQGLDHTMVVPFPNNFLVAGHLENMRAFAFLATQEISDD